MAVGLPVAGPRADQAGDERAGGLGLGRAADADEAAAALDVALERGLLRGVQAIAVVVEEDDRAVAREVGRGEGRRVRGRIDLEAVRGAERLERRDAGVDRRVRRPVEHEHAWSLRRSARRADQTDREGVRKQRHPCVVRSRSPPEAP